MTPPTTTKTPITRYTPEMFIPHRVLGDGVEIYFPCMRCMHYGIGRRCTFYPEHIPSEILAGALACSGYGKSCRQQN